jgi:hypothetical protein
VCVRARAPARPAVSLFVSSVNVWMPEPIFINLVTVSRHLSPSQRPILKNPSHQSVCLYVYPPIASGRRLRENSPIVAKQRLGRNVAPVMNTHAAIEELLDASFSMWPVSYQGK